MNIAHLSGNLATDIELLRFDDKSLCKFTLAVNHGDRATFMPVEVWNQDHLPNHLHKGSRALVSGNLKQDQWETDAGERRSRIVLNGHLVEFLDRREGGGAGGANYQKSQPRQNNDSSPRRRSAV